jgi:hypothetical protein
MLAEALPKLPDRPTPDQRRSWAQQMHAFHEPVCWAGGSEFSRPLQVRIVAIEQEHCFVKAVKGNIEGRFKARFNELKVWDEQEADQWKPRKLASKASRNEAMIREALANDEPSTPDAAISQTDEPVTPRADALKNDTNVDLPEIPQPPTQEPPVPAPASKDRKGTYIIDVKNRRVWGGANFGFRKIEKLDTTEPFKTEGRMLLSWEGLLAGTVANGKFNDKYDKASLRQMTYAQAQEFANNPNAYVPDSPQAASSRIRFVSGSAIQDSKVAAAFTDDLRALKRGETELFEQLLQLKAQMDEKRQELKELEKQIDETAKQYAIANANLRNKIVG